MRVCMCVCLVSKHVTATERRGKMRFERRREKREEIANGDRKIDALSRLDERKKKEKEKVVSFEREL